MRSQILEENLLFKSDNLKVLKALAQTHERSIKLAYLDPPYNTRIDRKHFQDDRKSNDWVKMMHDRLSALKGLLREDGSVWISIDDSELPNLKLLCDDIFGKENFLSVVVWQHRIKWDGYQGKFDLNHTYLVAYRKSVLFEFENNARPSTVWLESAVGGHAEALAESKELFGEENVFSTPKPESLMKYLLQLTTKEDDLVLDAFSGSGTMGAAAQKMNRRWIMMEIGDQYETHILPRMQKFSSQENSRDFRFFTNVTEYEAISSVFLLRTLKNRTFFKAPVLVDDRPH